MQAQMPAGFANHTCVYCRAAPSTRTGDHIFARSFFLVDRRANLPKAPACDKCGGEKSKHEHYLATVLPFGGVHEDALPSLETLVEPRLAKNRPLQRELASGFDERSPDGNYRLPFEVGALRELFRCVAVGLLWHHRRTYLPASHEAIAFTPPDDILPTLAQALLDLNGHRLEGDVGQGTFRYVANVSQEDGAMSAWFFQIMSGLKMTGDPQRPDATVSSVVAITGHRSTIDIVRHTWLDE